MESSSDERLGGSGPQHAGYRLGRAAHRGHRVRVSVIRDPSADSQPQESSGGLPVRFTGSRAFHRRTGAGAALVCVCGCGARGELDVWVGVGLVLVGVVVTLIPVNPVMSTSFFCNLHVTEVPDWIAYLTLTNLAV